MSNVADPSPTAQVGAMLAVSRAVAAGGPLFETLDAIAEQAAGVAGDALATSILLIAGRDQPWLMAGSYGLSEGYGARVRDWPTPQRRGQTLSELTVEDGAPVLIDDTETDPRYAAWRDMARAEGFRSFLSVPLGAPRDWLGSLNVYRVAPGPWPSGKVALMTFFAEHAASAIRTAQLLDQRATEVFGLRHLVRALEEQTHEHANRLHAVSGLLQLGEQDDALDLLDQIESVHHGVRTAVRSRIANPALAGLIVADAGIAHQRSIRFEVDPQSAFTEGPAVIQDSQLLTIVGNLLDNAFDAVAEMPVERRRVTLLLLRETKGIVIEVRDWGCGISDDTRRIFERGVSTHGEHRGIGLGLVETTTRAAHGEIEVVGHDDGTTFRVRLPNA